MMLVTKRMIFLVLGFCASGAPLEVCADQALEDLRDRRQAIYREFGFASRVNVLEETCEQFAQDQQNIELLKKIDIAIALLKSVFARYADALLTCVKADDLNEPEEFFWAGFWDKIKWSISSQVEELYHKILSDVTAAKDPAETVDCAKILFEPYLRRRVAEIIGQKIIDRCGAQIGG